MDKFIVSTLCSEWFFEYFIANLFNRPLGGHWGKFSLTMSVQPQKLQQQLQAEATIYQSVQKDLEKAIQNRTQLESQLKENEQVLAVQIC
jgi:hypothetical protein